MSLYLFDYGPPRGVRAHPAAPKKRKGFCKQGHRLTRENRGHGGQCRLCVLREQREAQRRREERDQGLGVPVTRRKPRHYNGEMRRFMWHEGRSR